MKEDVIKNKKLVVTLLTIYSIIFILAVIYVLLNDQKIDKKNLNVDFAGSIKSVDYDIKQNPTIIIGDSSYYIGAGYYTGHQIEAGDSIIKKKARRFIH